MFATLLIRTFGFSRSLSQALPILLLLPLFSIFGTGYAQDNNSNSGSNINDTKEEGKGQDNTTINNIISVTIPRGSANPEVDITNLAPRQWYIPRQVTVNEGEIVNWTNQDTEAHTVTSGIGAGIESLLTNRQGKPTGIFDSGLFKAGESWSYNFTKAGRYSYFCTIHPWMEGMVMVKEKRVAIDLPGYPVDSSGNRLGTFPVHTLTNDQKYDIDLSWDPKVIVTGKPVNFIIDFFDPHTNKRLHLLPYDFIISRNGTEIDRISNAFSEVGTDIQKVIFSGPGPIAIRIENVGDTPAYTQFGTLVYNNPEQSKETNQESASADTTTTTTTTNIGIISDDSSTSPFSRLISPLTFVYITYAIIAGIPAAVAVIVVLFRKGII
jgi:plastocyanin